jgi:regulator of ribonuclease activity A
MTFTTADLCDAHGSDVAVIDPILRSYGGRRRFHGVVATVKVHEDNVLVRQALGEAGHGRVLVVDGGGSTRCALVGDALVRLACDNGWAGLVVFGSVRDAAALAAIDLGVLAPGTHPRRSQKHGAGWVDVPVALAGVVVRPGDHLYADEDGVVVARRDLRA